ncbi:ArsR/SmtB family transcription factor [Corynebacterium uberis]|uniref:ArsR/SmtB family transcription factor n=2 Tax=Corynebacteriaceae TaxID=1653 RepID=UPI001D09DCA5|nr:MULTISPECIES: metalloregulator ArsR/SmtB family transcription factor [Corynebacterium]MCZ9308213.1 metalloregulator ArsR/SmtB family transcription factor [Corynebacterium sp. c6VSa_13]UDL73894.1 metalloregulator ArsR/SmtB family transcription factor [Corynebacterium uberis]UDL77434.1 metalloregulator ArsR/SmtB family transcription factor [Corynebacterium uberis]UDL81851.1 metalloregulator ArsR/SmtB family transcription factor [Corynebacterium uberis]UDL84061.1 metalloregulator ArsR/SmtB fam
MATTQDKSPSEIESRRTAALFGALDSELRIRIIELLNNGDHFVHELVRALGKSQPLISQHLKVLKRSGIVESERHGREVIYRLVHPTVIQLIDQARALIAAIHQLPSEGPGPEPGLAPQHNAHASPVISLDTQRSSTPTHPNQHGPLAEDAGDAMAGRPAALTLSTSNDHADNPSPLRTRNAPGQGL